MAIRVIGGISVIVLVLFMNGCNSQSDARIKRLDELKIIGIMLANYPDYPTAAPGKMEDFEPLLRSYSMEEMKKIFDRADLDPAAGIREGRYVVLWGTTIPANAMSQTCMAYERDAAESGGWVLFANGECKRVTAEEFKQDRGR